MHSLHFLVFIWNKFLTKTMSVIREAATRYPTSSWRTYDEPFHLRQVSESTRQSLGSLTGELWYRVMSTPLQNSISTSIWKQTVLDEPAAALNQQNIMTCNASNEGSCTWKVCKFRHVCVACNSSLHGQFNCPHVFQNISAGQHLGFKLQGNFNADDAHFILNVFMHVFSLNYVGRRWRTLSLQLKNLKSHSRKLMRWQEGV